MPIETRLFRALVVFGASLTGGAVINACTGGSGVDTEAAGDASADGEYAKISADYGRISPAPQCTAPTCYPRISPATPCPNGGSAPCDSDAGDAGDASDASDSG